MSTIRWDNIDRTGGNYNAATYASAQGSKQINDSFQNLQGMLTAQNAVNKGNWENQQGNNDTDVKSFINNLAAQGPDALRTAMDDNQVQNKINSFGGFLSKDVREMTGQKALNQSQADWLAQDQYGDEVADNAAEPFINTLTNLANSGPEGLGKARALAQTPEYKSVLDSANWNGGELFNGILASQNASRNSDLDYKSAMYDQTKTEKDDNAETAARPHINQIIALANGQGPNAEQNARDYAAQPEVKAALDAFGWSGQEEINTIRDSNLDYQVTNLAHTENVENKEIQTALDEVSVNNPTNMSSFNVESALKDLQAESGLFDSAGNLLDGVTEGQLNAFQNSIEDVATNAAGLDSEASFRQFFSQAMKIPGIGEDKVIAAWKDREELDKLTGGFVSYEEQRKRSARERTLKKRTNFDTNPLLADERNGATASPLTLQTTTDILLASENSEVKKLLGENKKDWFFQDKSGGPQSVVREFNNLLYEGVEGSDGKMHLLTRDMLPELLLGFRDGEGLLSFGTGKIDGKDIRKAAKKLVDQPGYMNNEKLAFEYRNSINDIRYPPSSTDIMVNKLYDLQVKAPEQEAPPGSTGTGWYNQLSNVIQKFGGR